MEVTSTKKAFPLWAKIIIGFLGLASLFFIIIALIPVKNEAEFSKIDMGEAWPFKDIESGTVSCSSEGGIIFEADNGKTYALNGLAKTLVRGSHPEWIDSGEIHIIGKDISPILSKGLTLCEGKK